MIPYGRQDISDADIAAVGEVLRSDYLTQGPQVPAFEAKLTTLCHVPHAVAVNSATSALHLACLALDVGPGDVVWTSPITFVASANCALYCGASIDFVDIDPRTYNMSAERLADQLSAARRAGRLPKVVIPVHLTGQPCDMKAIAELRREYGFRVVEDASHAIGAAYDGGPVGDCRFSEATVFSFHPVKIVTTAEGGAITTQNEALAARLRRLRSHGITRDPAEMTGPPEGPWYYEQIELGFNYRMTDVHAVLGSSQLRRITDFVARRRELAARYDRLLADVPVVRPHQSGEGESAWHLYVVRVPREGPRDRATVFARMREQGIGVNVHYIPVYHQPYYGRFNIARSRFPEAERYYAEAISLPMYYGLTDQQQDEVVAALVKALAP